MARDIQGALSSTCSYCGRPYLNRADVTLDIFDPQHPPFYGVNTRWCCNTCNQAKGEMDPHDFGIWQALWRRRNRHGLMPCQQPRMFTEGD